MDCFNQAVLFMIVLFSIFKAGHYLICPCLGLGLWLISELFMVLFKFILLSSAQAFFTLSKMLMWSSKIRDCRAVVFRQSIIIRLECFSIFSVSSFSSA